MRNCDVTEAKNPARSFASDKLELCTLAHNRLNMKSRDVRILRDASALDSFFGLRFELFDLCFECFDDFFEVFDR